MSVREVTNKRIMQAFLALGFVSLTLSCRGDARKRYSHICLADKHRFVQPSQDTKSLTVKTPAPRQTDHSLNQSA
jgi:hypothetical protein